MDLQTPLREIDWIAPQRTRILDKINLATVGDLLTHYPRRHEDRSRFDRFPGGESEQPICVCGTVVKTTQKRFGGWKKMFEVVLEEDGSHALSPPLICRWFNVHYVQKMFATGQRVVVYGKPKLRGKNICIDHPEFESVENDEEVSIHLQRITPIYRATEGVSTRVLRTMIFRLLEEIGDAALPDFLPSTLDSQPLGAALRELHFPSSWETLGEARRRLVLGEFFHLQLLVAARRAETIARAGEVHAGGGMLLQALHEGLAYQLTVAQQRVIAEIRADLASTQPMNRLLQGDVGSGKTVVALSAMLLVVEAGFQAALMAPTQILAEQHYLNFKRLLEPLGVSIALRTGARKEETTALPLFAVGGIRDPVRGTAEPDPPSSGRQVAGAPRAHIIRDNEPNIFVGTHALLYEGAGISRLGLAVIDEQHKFGVMQRARLIAQGSAPDILVMTATPIPRTLTMTIYGDLDVSTLDEMPAHRGAIRTEVRDAAKLPDIVKFLVRQITEGRQAYVVHPLIDESDNVEAKAAAAEFERWRGLLNPARCELLHGRVAPDEKDQIMERFRTGATQALITTTVVEVGVDVPNATIMLIQNAERFGLAQLHQLRGRIGRGQHRSYCILISAAKNDEAREKLDFLARVSDGFAIAEEDLRLRGPGDILGTAQTGLPPLKLGNPLADAELMQIARNAAGEIFKNDPLLQHPRHQSFRRLISAHRKPTLSQVS